MHKNILHILYWIAIFSGISGNIASQTTAYSNTIKRILADMEQYDLKPDGRQELDISSLCPGKKLYIRYEDGYVSDIGIRLFPDIIKQPALPPVVYDFVERYFLSLLLKKTKSKQQHLLREDFCFLQVGGDDFSRSSCSMAEILQTIREESPLEIQNDSLLFTFRWNQSPDRKREVVFIFPKQYDLIYGKDKKEILFFFYHELLREANRPEPDSTIFQSAKYHAEKNIYSFTDGCYLIPQVKSGVHFQKKDSTLLYLLNERFAEESLSNLFSYADQMDYLNPLELEIRGYKFSKVIPFTLRQLSAFMRERHCKAYLGIEEYDKQEYTGTVFYINRELMYKHLLYFHFPKKAFKQKGIPIKAVLYPFIPIQNIGTLYDRDTKIDSNIN